MNKKSRRKQTKRVVLLSGVVVTITWAAASYLLPENTLAQSRSAVPEAQFTAGGSEQCLRCHGGEAMTSVLDTAHGNLDNPHTPFANHGCESCHGPGSLHVSRARGGAGFPPLLDFDREETDIAVMNAACTACHEDDMGELEGIAWTGSVHGTEDVTCIDCHAGIHAYAQPMADRARQVEACAGCHEEQIAEHRRFEERGIVFENLACYDCHDVHQLIGE